ncbi:hypothetical protein INR49_001075 [Caranx melampygus]|nr:hypothetical protein INR49_001075 [Caranx melampygus]
MSGPEHQTLQNPFPPLPLLLEPVFSIRAHSRLQLERSCRADQVSIQGWRRHTHLLLNHWRSKQLSFTVRLRKMRHNRACAVK